MPPLLLLAVSLSATICRAAQAQPWGASRARIDSLLQRMTLEEKVGEMTQLTIQAVSATRGPANAVQTLDSAKLERALVHDHVGSLLNVWDVALSPAQWTSLITTVQRVARKKRVPIPVLYGIDAVHGHNYMRGATLFPQNIAMAATWNPALVREENAITAREVRAAGIPWSFSPVLDLGRQPLWSRFFETFGEDVYLASVMATQAVEGLQGAGRRDAPLRVAATAKHFLGYSMPLTGRDRTTAWIPERQLREYFVPTFSAAINAGIRTVMVNSGDVNGVPVHASHEILTDLLRGELGFRGVVVTDWEDIGRLVTTHHVAATMRDAVRMAIDAGIDMSMTPYDTKFAELLVSLVRAGEIGESRIDESVRRILTLKMDLGLFDDPLPDTSASMWIGSPASREISRRAAEEAITLLKNDGVLPLARGTRVLVTGPGARSLPAQFGSWTYSWQGDDPALYPRDTPTLLDAVRAELGVERVHYVESIALDGRGSSTAAVKAAAGADVVIVALAERPTAEKPGDLESLELPRAERELALAMERTGKPVIVTLFQNRPRIVRPIVDAARAIVLAYETGPFGGEALARVLSGAVNPSGRLPFTYPRASGSLEHYDHTASADVPANDSVAGYRPEWDFGHGLSYATFAYSGLRVDTARVGPRDTATVSVTVTNTGTLGGQVVVQVYVRDVVASVDPPVRRLRAFTKIYLAPGEARIVKTKLPISRLAFVGRDNRWVVEPGEFSVMVGGLTARLIVAIP
jgi:beta-glucosidase